MAGHVTKIKLKLKGVNELMRSEPVQAHMDQVGRRMAAAAGPGISYLPKPHKWTARGYVQTTTAEGRRREAEDKVLLSALSAGRG